jgi:molecular chaperone DnaJ
LKIPAGTANGRTFRVRGKGVTRKDGTKGDLLASIDVQVPAGLNDEAREALERFAETTKGEDPRQALLEAAQGS